MADQRNFNPLATMMRAMGAASKKRKRGSIIPAEERDFVGLVRQGKSAYLKPGLKSKRKPTKRGIRSRHTLRRNPGKPCRMSRLGYVQEGKKWVKVTA